MSNYQWMEDEANNFALVLLMPERLLRQEIAKLDGFDLTNDKDLEYLAKVFEVPTTAMVVRLCQLKIFKP